MSEELTAWGRWLVQQPRGTRERAARQCGVAATTVDDAKRRRVSREIAELFAKFSGGAVRVDDIAKPRRKLAPLPKRSRKAVA